MRELEKKLPKDANITEVSFEGPQIVIYTANPDFFKRCEDVIKDIVSIIKKRIEVRPDKSICKDMEFVKKKINEIVGKDADIRAIYFEPELGKVVIETSKPGMVIGKGGEIFRKIKEETLWLPCIERAPAIESPIVRAVRNLMHTEIDYRKKFLNRLGQRINVEMKSGEKWIRLTALGGFREVGRSCLLLHTNESLVMMDCGIDASNNTHPYINAAELDLNKLDAVILTHPHLDHCGFIPYLYENGYNGPLYCTAPARDLMVLLLLDYIDICHREGKEVYFSKKSIERTIKHVITLNYGEVFDITPDIKLTLYPAGHLLGSSLVHLHIGSGFYNVLYTGDFKFGPTRLFNPAYTDFPRVETVIIESTYGNRKGVMPTRKESEEKLLKIIDETMKKGGKVIIPSFAVGRAQEIMIILDHYKFDYPVYLDGMIWDATAIHTAYPEYLSTYLQKQILHKNENPFLNEIFRRVTPKERTEIIDSGDPCVIIATSGMLIGGPVMEYLKAFAGYSKNTLIFVGYQAPGTLGSKIQRGWKELPIKDESGITRTLEIKMRVESIEGLSGHSDRKQLFAYLYNIKSKFERIIVNHGDERICSEFSKDLSKTFRVNTKAPRNLDTIRLK